MRSEGSSPSPATQVSKSCFPFSERLTLLSPMETKGHYVQHGDLRWNMKEGAG